MSDKSKSIFDALSDVMADVTAVAKEGNSGQGYSFRGIDAVLTAVAPALRRHGVIVAPHVESCDVDSVEVGRQQTRMSRCRVVVTYRFHGPAGDHLDARVAAEAADSSDKATTKAMSIAFRTVLLQVLALPVQDADGITPPQLRAMMAGFTQAGLRERADRLTFASGVIGRELESSTELTIAEAGEVIDALRLVLVDAKPEGATP